MNPGTEDGTIVTAALLAVLTVALPMDTLEVRLVANAGVVLSDGETSLVFDLPYQSGYSGYAEYDPSTIDVTGRVVAAITHEHLDHFEPDLFRARDWEIVAGPPVERLVVDRPVLSGDSLVIGAFSLVAVPTTHIPHHRSYRVRWGDRVVFVPGDAENAEALTGQPPLDVAFVTPWLACAVRRAGARIDAARIVGYHRSRSDDFCGPAETLPADASIRLPADTR